MLGQASLSSGAGGFSCTETKSRVKVLLLFQCVGSIIEYKGYRVNCPGRSWLGPAVATELKPMPAASAPHGAAANICRLRMAKKEKKKKLAPKRENFYL